MCTLFVARVAQISSLRLALVGRRSHKNLDRGRHKKGKGDYLTSVAKQAKTAFLHGPTVWKVADRRDRTRNLSLRKRCTKTCGGEATLWISYVREILVEHVHSPCLPFRELTVPWLLNGETIERIACVTQSTELDGDAENSLLLRFRLQQIRQASKGYRMAWAFIDLRGTRNFDDVCWVAALRLQSLPETAKICRKNTNNGEWTSHRRGKEAQVAKNKRFPLTCCWGRHVEGACSCPKSLSTPSRTFNWREMGALWQWQVDRDSCRSTCSRSTLSELSPRARHNQNNRRSPVFDRSLAKHSPHWHQNVFPTGEAGGHKSKSGSLSFSPDWASAAAASVSSTVLYSASCRSFYGVTSLLCEAKKWEQNRRQTTMKKC